MSTNRPTVSDLPVLITIATPTTPKLRKNSEAHNGAPAALMPFNFGAPVPAPKMQFNFGASVAAPKPPSAALLQQKLEVASADALFSSKLNALHARLISLCREGDVFLKRETAKSEEELYEEAVEILDAAAELLEGGESSLGAWLDNLAPHSEGGDPQSRATALFLCAENGGSLHVVLTLLLERGADPAIPATSPAWGEYDTPGTVAAFRGNTNIVLALAKFPDTLEAADDDLETCAHKLANSNQVDCIEALFAELPRARFRDLFLRANVRGAKPWGTPDANMATRDLVRRLLKQAEDETMTKSANKTS
jgi:hypothetical protein